MDYKGDLHKIRTYDGNELVFPDENNRLLTYIGYGAPPIQYITQRGYKQHGETKIDYVLDPRTVSIELWKNPACDRATYWLNRAALHDILRPNRGGSLELTLITPDGNQRAILLDPTPGALFDTPQTDDNNWEINESLDFIAFDPIWYNADQTVTAVAQDTTQNLVFPITFPIVFGPGGATYSLSIVYAGTWQSYPILTINGPYTSVVIENQTTGAEIELIVPIGATESRTIDLTPGALSVYDHDGNDAFDELGANSNLVDFVIQPDPIAPGGVNDIQAQITGATAGSGFTVQYRERYFAL